MSIDCRDGYKCDGCGKLYSDICQDWSHRCPDCKKFGSPEEHREELEQLRAENEELRKLVRQVWSWDREATWEELVSHYPILQHNS